jgi:hypothetical protein
MNFAARLDDIPKPAWIALMVVGFIVFWPIGLGILAYLFWSGRMNCRHNGRWHDERRADRDERRADREARRADRHQRFHEAASRWWHGDRAAPSSGNHAFDEYREETLRRLEDEQREFRDYLDRLRHAKDKAEFDAFLADRRRRPEAPPRDEPPPVPPSADPAR